MNNDVLITVINENIVIASIFGLICPIIGYFYFVRKHEFSWKTIYFLMFPLISILAVSYLAKVVNLEPLFRAVLENAVAARLISISLDQLRKIGEIKNQPKVCRGCSFYYGDYLVCAVHPYGPEEDSLCADKNF